MAPRDLPPEPPSSEITPLEAYQNRRAFLKNAGLFGLTAAAWGGGLVALTGRGKGKPKEPPPKPPGQEWVVAERGRFATDEPKTPFDDITTYNNFYELGISKSDPSRNAGSLKLRPWQVRVEGEIAEPKTLDIDALLRSVALEERVYRMRCVEAWSMVIPWLGFPLGEFLRRFDPTSRAKYVELTTLRDSAQLPGQSSDVLDWPYVEALRIDEAMNPLTLLAVGLYEAPLLGQNGAPLRLVVPWKYGFKGVKSIVKIRLTERRPKTTWASAAPAEYGFYANVNPAVDHPRWSQATERRIGDLGRRETRMFNGYAEQVASMYAGMDLKRDF